MKCLIFVAPILFFVFIGTIYSVENPQTEFEVTAVGTSLLADAQNNKTIARDRAVMDALRKAVEQGIGVYIDAVSQMEDFTVVKDEIVTEAKGYVKRYEIESEGVNRDGDLYEVEINAVVDMANLESSDAIQGYLKKKNWPRTMVLISEIGDNAEEGTVPQAEAIIIQELTNRYFPVVDAEEVANETTPEEASESVKKTSQAQILARRFNAEIIIIGKVSVTYREAFKTSYGPIMNAQVDLSLKAVNTSSGRVFASRTAHGTANHINKSTARLEAIKSACQSAIVGYKGEEEGIITQIIRKWTRNVHITLIISELKSDTQLISLETAIKSNIRGVQSLIRRSFNLEKGEAQLEIVSSLDAQSTMTDLTQKNLGIKIAVTSFAGDRIEIRIKE